MGKSTALALATGLGGAWGIVHLLAVTIFVTPYLAFLLPSYIADDWRKPRLGEAVDKFRCLICAREPSIFSVALWGKRTGPSSRA